MAKEKKSSTKSKLDEQTQLLNLLRTILPKVAPDPAFAEKLYSAFEAELRAKNRVGTFENVTNMAGFWHGKGFNPKV